MAGSLLGKLGLEAHDRAALVHADDLGMCHAANVAFWENLDFGIVTCGAVMMPCPWVSELAAQCRERQERGEPVDVGVHITLNSEWDRYRWRPLSTCDPQSGLIDEEGYMWKTVEDVHRHMDVDAAIAEMRAQVEYALSLGIDVTHIDTHMGTVMHPQLLPAYIQLAIEYRVPAMLPRIPKERLAEWGVPESLGRELMRRMDELIASGFPVLDNICAAREQGDHLEIYRRLFDSLPPGVTHFLLHPCAPGYDIEFIAGSAAYRIADYQTFLRSELKEHVAAQGIHLIGYRHLRALMRRG